MGLSPYSQNSTNFHYERPTMLGNIVGKKTISIPNPKNPNTVPVYIPKTRPPAPVVSHPLLNSNQPVEELLNEIGKVLEESHLTGQSKVKIVAEWLFGPQNPSFQEKLFNILFTRVGSSIYYQSVGTKAQYDRLLGIKEEEIGCGCGGKSKTKLRFLAPLDKKDQ